MEIVEMQSNNAHHNQIVNKSHVLAKGHGMFVEIMHCVSLQ